VTLHLVEIRHTEGEVTLRDTKPILLVHAYNIGFVNESDTN